MKKLGIIILAVMFVIASIGVAYATVVNPWSQSLFANGTATTATFGAHLGDAVSSTPVGNASYSIAVGGTNNNTLTLTIANAYPTLSVTLPFYVYNDSSIPLSSVAVTAGPNMDSNINFSATAPIGAIAVGGYGTGSMTVTMDNVAPGTPYNFNVTLSANQ